MPLEDLDRSVRGTAIYRDDLEIPVRLRLYALQGPLKRRLCVERNCYNRNHNDCRPFVP